MLSELDRLQRAANNTLEKANTTLNENFSNIETHLTAVRDEYLRVAEFSGQAMLLMKLTVIFRKRPN